MLAPVLVCGTGRGGTTLMMQLLATSPRIAMHRQYVYEHFYFRYLLEWAALPLRRRWPAERWNAGVLVFPPAASLDERLMGPFPWEPRDLLGDPEMLARAWFRAAWREFSVVAAEQTRSRLGHLHPVTHYAEKCDRIWALTGTDWVPTRVIALVRDPRDTWLSVLAFDRRRGYTGFGRGAREPEDRYLARFIAEQREHLVWATGARGNRANVLAVYYEDLATDLRRQASRLGSWLGLELDADAVTRARPALAHHVTTPSPAASVGRWRAGLSDERRRMFAEQLGDELRAHGYEP